MNRDDFDSMWFGEELEQKESSGCVALFAAMVLVFIALGVGIWYAVTR